MGIDVKYVYIDSLSPSQKILERPQRQRRNIQYSLSAIRHHSTLSSTSERNLILSHPTVVLLLSLTLNQKQAILLVPLLWNKKSFYSILVETIKELIGSEAHRCESNADRLF